MKAFGLRYGCNVWVIAHPSKTLAPKPGKARVAPGPMDISGSAQFGNKADVGVTIHSPSPCVTEVHLWKPRFKRFGVRDTVGILRFEAETNCFYSPAPNIQDDLPTSWHDTER